MRARVPGGRSLRKTAGSWPRTVSRYRDSLRWARYFCYGTVRQDTPDGRLLCGRSAPPVLVRWHKLDGLGTRQFPETRLYQEYGLLRFGILECVVTSWA